MSFDIPIKEICESIQKRKAKRVGLQIPEGLKTRAVGIADELREKTGAEVIIFADPCYGACDTRDTDAERFNLDMIVHLGHDEWAL